MGISWSKAVRRVAVGASSSSTSIPAMHTQAREQAGSTIGRQYNRRAAGAYSASGFLRAASSRAWLV